MSIEDTMFAKALEIKGIKRTQSMYEKADHPHICSMCQDENTFNKLGYRMRVDTIRDYSQPYLFVCEECFNSLPKGDKE